MSVLTYRTAPPGARITGGAAPVLGDLFGGASRWRAWCVEMDLGIHYDDTEEGAVARLRACLAERGVVAELVRAVEDGGGL